MKPIQIFASLLFLQILLAGGALAQREDQEPADQLANDSPIAMARTRYERSPEADAAPSHSEAQRPLQGPRRGVSLPPRSHYPRGNSPLMWSGGNPRATFIGALIGFGLGAAVGAKVNSDNHGGAAAKAVLVFGSLGALIGAVAGQSFEPAHFRRDYRRRFPEDEESDEFRSSSRAVRR